MYRLFKETIANSIKTINVDDFESGFNYKVLSDIDHNDYGKVEKFIKHTLNYYPSFLSKTNQQSLETQNKYLKQLFIRHVEERNLILATLTLILKNPISPNLDEFKYFDKKLTKDNLRQHLKRDLEISDKDNIFTVANKNHLIAYLVNELLLVVNNRLEYFVDVELQEDNYDIFQAEYKNVFMRLKGKINNKEDIESFWDSYI